MHRPHDVPDWAWWHEVTDYAEPRGWHHQLKTEPAIQLYLTRSFQVGWRSEDYWGLDIVPHVKGFLTTFLTLGIEVSRMRIGLALGQELFTPSPLSIALANSNSRSRTKTSSPSPSSSTFSWRRAPFTVNTSACQRRCEWV